MCRVIVFLALLAVSRALPAKNYDNDKYMHHHILHKRSTSQQFYVADAEQTVDYWRSSAQASLLHQLKKTEITSKAKNIILFLGDGMSIPTLAAARAYQGQIQGKSGEESKLSFEEFPYTALSKTYCVDRQVPDSACTATSYLCGVKSNYGTIGVSPLVPRDNCALMSNASYHVSSLGRWAQLALKSTGVVTTTRVTHASPSGVYAHTSERDWESDKDVHEAGETYCVDRQVPDSACTATSYLCGVKSNYGTIGVSPLVPRDNCALMSNASYHVSSLGRWAQLALKSTGVVTTTRVTHASPSGVYAHTSERDWESDKDVHEAGEVCEDIATQMVEGKTGRRLNVVLGGGRRKFLPQNITDEEGVQGERLDNRNLISEWEASKQSQGLKAEYVWNRDQLLNVQPDTDYLLGLFDADHCPYHLDADPDTEPTLAEMTEAAVKVLEKNENGCFLFVEGGRRKFLPQNITDEEGVQGERLDNRNLISEWEASKQSQGLKAEYVWNRDQLLNVQPDTDYLMGLFDADHCPYHLDADPDTEPTLAEMTEAAVKVLEKNENGCFLFVEGGRRKFLPQNITDEEGVQGERLDNRNLISEWEASKQSQGLKAEYVWNRDQLLNVQPDTDYLMGLFDADHCPYHLDADPDTEPTLAEMTEAAVKVLEKNENGCFLFVEGGRRKFLPQNITDEEGVQGERLDNRNLISEWEASKQSQGLKAEYVWNRDQLLNVQPDTDYLMGLFDADHCPYHLDADPDTEPTLAEMTEAAVKVLEKNENGCFLFVEGGRRKFLPQNITDEEGVQGERLDNRNLISEWEASKQSQGLKAEYVWNRDQLLNVQPDTDYLMGLFDADHCPYHLDADPDTEPTLAEMTEAAVKVLEKNENGCFLFVEGGRRKFLPQNITDEEGVQGERLDNRNLISEWEASKQSQGLKAEYVWNRDQLLNVQPDTDYLMGLFDADHCPYHLDADPDTEPTLAEMTEAAVKVLEKNENGYFLFVEGGRIDHAHHDTKAQKALDETIQFSEAIRLARKITNLEDTLIVVTSDHAHTMSMAGYPKRGNDIFGIAGMSSKDKRPYSTLSYANGPGYQNVDEDGNRHDISEDNMDDKNYQFPSIAPLSSETHGGDDVGIFASGPWAHLFTGVLEQNVIPHFMAYAACIGYGATMCDS